MKRTTTNYTGIAACRNDRCPSHKNCLRWQIGKRNPQIIAGQFAPKSKYSQRCGDFKPKTSEQIEQQIWQLLAMTSRGLNDEKQ